jgi:Lipid A 3-O-deacylase (PagL)
MKSVSSLAGNMTLTGSRIAVLVLFGFLMSLQAGETSGANAVALQLRPIADPADTNAPEPGFQRGDREAGIALGAGVVAANRRDKNVHTFELAKIHCGWILGGMFAPDYWIRGHWEIAEEIFGGGQSSPAARFVAGETTVIRYNFATRTRLQPFIDGGIGALGTDVGRPNLGSVFEFNEFGGGGVNYFWRPRTAFSLEYRYYHISDGGVASPNGGLGMHTCYAGVTWLF